MGLGGPRNAATIFEDIRCFEAEASIASNNVTFWSDCVVIPGDSGGPVFNENMEIVGTVLGGHTTFTDKNDLYNDDPTYKGIFGEELGFPLVWPAKGPSVTVINSLLAQLQDEEE